MLNTLMSRVMLVAFCAGGPICGAAYGASFDCVITPAVTVQVGTPVSGVLAEVLVDQGDVVIQGQIIARLRSEVENMTAELLELQALSTAEIEAQQSRLSLARKRLERAQDLVSRNVGTREALEAAEAEVEVITRELAIAEMRHKVADLEWRRANAQVEQRVMRSPLDGVVVARHLFGGEFMGTEDSVVAIAKVDPLYVEAFLPVTAYRDVSIGMSLSVSPEPPLQGTFQAEITVIDQVFDAASGTFGIRLEMPNSDAAIPAGHRCQIDIAVAGQ